MQKSHLIFATGLLGRCSRLPWHGPRPGVTVAGRASQLSKKVPQKCPDLVARFGLAKGAEQPIAWSTL